MTFECDRAYGRLLQTGWPLAETRQHSYRLEVFADRVQGGRWPARVVE